LAWTWTPDPLGNGTGKLIFWVWGDGGLLQECSFFVFLVGTVLLAWTWTLDPLGNGTGTVLLLGLELWILLEMEPLWRNSLFGLVDLWIYGNLVSLLINFFIN